MTAEAHYIPGIDPGSGMVGAPGCSMIRYFKAATTAEMNSIADELDGDLCYVLASDVLHISQNGVWSIVNVALVLPPSMTYGTRAARPAAAIEGRQYFAYDQAAVYLDSGTAWVRISTPAGVTAHFDGTLAPIGWILRDGTQYDKTNLLYEDLFNAIGYTHGGAGNYFSVSNALGRVSVARSGADTEFDVVGEKVGAKTHVLTEAQLAFHRHSFAALGSGGGPQRGLINEYWDNVTYTTSVGTGGDQPHNNIQPSIVGLGIVKL